MARETIERARVVAEARKWVGTPYHACADVRGAGVDCGMLLVRVFVDTGLLAPFDPRPYPEDWHLHRSEERYLYFASDRLGEVAEPGPGDIIVFKYGRTFSHGAIVTGIDPNSRCACVSALPSGRRGRFADKSPIARTKAAATLLQPLGLSRF